MNNAQEQQFRTLCREMRQWTAELTARLANMPPIGLHFFIWRELTQPTWSCGYDEHNRPLEEPSWHKFQEANEGRVAQAIGGSEKWGELPWGMGRFRFFGRADAEELAKSVGTIMELLKNADETLTKYQQLPVPMDRRWKVHRGVRVHPMGHRLSKQHRLLSLVSLSKGYDYDDAEIFIQEDEWPFDKQFTPYDQEFIHEPWDGVRIPTDVYVVQDFAAAFTQAVNTWITEEIELGTQEQDEPEWEDDIPESQPASEAALPIVKSITVKMGNEGLVLHAGKRRPVSIPPELAIIFSPFVANIADNNPGRVVEWNLLHQCIGDMDADGGKANLKLRRAMVKLRIMLLKLGQPPDRGLWIIPRKSSKGCHLNTECNWWASKAVVAEYIEHFRRTTDPKTLEENTPDKDHKLPAQSWHPHNRRHSNSGD